MKVILNQDVKYLGEEGDVKAVANGYARNYLFPRGFAVPYNEHSAAIFESRRGEIDERKKAKRTDAASVKERLEATAVNLTVSAGPTGKLYGAVTSQTIADILVKQGFDIERKRIDIPGLVIKHTGKYPVTVRLYEAMVATVNVVVEAEKAPERPVTTSAPRRSRYRDREAERQDFDARQEEAAAYAALDAPPAPLEAEVAPEEIPASEA
jgi:large subunit ribosomal protein L9